MLFNSQSFAIFFAIVFSLYFLGRTSHRWQNSLLLVASYVFYAAWDWRFLSLIVVSTLLDYVCGIKINQSYTPSQRKFFLTLSVCGNLSLLFFFKYFNFFIESSAVLLHKMGLPFHVGTLGIILPVGISFYTFQTMSYTIDIYRRELTPTKNIFDFALYVSFFPQLVAGPIERAKHLLPQILKPRHLTKPLFFEGLHLMYWGLFQKMFIADNLARIVDATYQHPGPYHANMVMLATYAFAFQILCDFEGYSNIARGIGKCLGFDIMVNFHLPYFVTNPRDFWRRWHISLSGWLRDYLYIPLGGSKGSTLRTYWNLFLTMLLGGLWHGAAWNFVLWGMYQGVVLMVHRVFNAGKTSLAGKIMWQKPSEAHPPSLSSPHWRGEHSRRKIKKIIWGVLFFHVICLGWLFFRADSLPQISLMLHSFYPLSIVIDAEFITRVRELAFFAGPFVAVMIFQAYTKDLLAPLRLRLPLRFAFYYALYCLLIIYGANSGQEFIYFQF